MGVSDIPLLFFRSSFPTTRLTCVINREQEMMDLAVDHVNRLKPRFVIVCGDLVNAFPYGDDKELQELQVCCLS